MIDPRQTMLIPFARRARMVTAMLVAGVWRGREAAEIEARIADLPPRGQSAVMAGVLGLLFLVSLFAAQFGLLGLALFLLAVIVLVA
jgi:hypothetical protein